MKPWVLNGIISVLIGGSVPVLTKMGLTGVSADIALSVKVIFTAIFIGIYLVFFVPVKAFGTLNIANWVSLALAAFTTLVSWFFYYRALKMSTVSQASLLEEGMVLVAVLLSVFFLKESLSWSIILGAILMFVGLYLITR